MNDIRAVLFDLDGTLLDSAPDLVAALNWVRATEGLGPVAIDSVRTHCSRGAAGLLSAGMPPADPARFDAWKTAFLERYAANSFAESRLFAGVTDVLDYMDRRQISWGIVTNKIERLTRPLLEAAGLAGRIACVVCGDTLARSKPDPAPVRHACTLLGTRPEQTLFVGDDVRDIQAGRAAGTRLGAVYYGYGSTELSDEVVGDSLRLHRPGDLLSFLA